MTTSDLGRTDKAANREKRAPYDPAQDQETARRRVAYGLCALIGLVVVAGLWALLFGNVGLDRVERISLFVGPLFGIAGTVLGFYFSQKR